MYARDKATNDVQSDRLVHMANRLCEAEISGTSTYRAVRRVWLQSVVVHGHPNEYCPEKVSNNRLDSVALIIIQKANIRNWPWMSHGPRSYKSLSKRMLQQAQTIIIVHISICIYCFNAT